LGFFGLPEEYKVILHKEIFTLAFYSEGAFPFSDVWELPTYLRKFYMKQLEETLEKRNTPTKKRVDDPSKNFAHVSKNVSTQLTPQTYTTRMKK
jgi:hypothetical protein